MRNTNLEMNEGPQTDTDTWWQADQLTPSPVPAALFVGAGISIDPPTHLPSGIVLTRALLEHTLDGRASQEIVKTLGRIAQLLGRELPRLEHVLGATCDTADLRESLVGGNPRDLLRLFEKCRPNRTHFAIANYVKRTKGWVITTNFDDCIEQASNWQIPVHVLRSTTGTIEISHGDSSSQWGLVKLHGSIEHGSEELVTTLRDLIPGLHPEYRSLLDQILDTCRTVIVAGYSGSDHFDVNHYLRGRRQLKKKPNLLWIEHSLERTGREYAKWRVDPLNTRHAWQHAFDRTRVEYGPTYDVLAKVLEEPHLRSMPTSVPPVTHDELIARFQELFSPSEEFKHLAAARLASGLGLAQLAQEEIDVVKLHIWVETISPDLQARILAQQGHFEAADAFLIQQYPPGAKLGLARGSLWRRGRRPLRALRLYFVSALRSRANAQDANSARVGLLETFLDLVEGAQRWAIFRSSASRSICRGITALVRSQIDAQSYPSWDVINASRAQMVWLRAWVLLDNDIKALFSNGTLWKLVAEQGIPEGSVVDGFGLDFPGIYLTSLSTAREQDDLDSMIQLRLEFVRIITSAIRRYGLNFWALWAHRLRTGSDFFSSLKQELELLISAVFENLEKADELSRAVGRPQARVDLARAVIDADTALGGLESWKRQRIYWGSRHRPCTITFTDSNGEVHMAEIEHGFELYGACSDALSESFCVRESRSRFSARVRNCSFEQKIPQQSTRLW